MIPPQPFLRTLREIVQGPPQDRLENAIGEITRNFSAMTCTLHRADPESKLLHLVASRGLPEPVLTRTRTIPFGKGMAGVCAERREPLTVCNLQTDESGVVRPGAKETLVGGALVVPIFSGDMVRGILGIGKAQDHTYSEEEIALLEACSQILEGLLEFPPMDQGRSNGSRD